MRYRLPLSQPITSKYLSASNCACCFGDSHSLKSFIAGVVHHDLGCHAKLLGIFSPELPKQRSCHRAVPHWPESKRRSRPVGRIATKALAWFITASVISLFIGLLLANVLQPGHGLGLALPEANATTNVQTGSLNVKDFAAHVFPISVVQAMAGNEVLQILVFSMFFGFALSAVKETLAPDIAKSIDQIVPVMLKFTDYVMRFAPLGVFAAMASVITTQGLGVGN
jgi:hypothetical protein